MGFTSGVEEFVFRINCRRIFFFYFGKLQQCSGDLETVGGPCSSIGIRSLSVASTRELLLYFVLWFGKD